MKKPTLWDVRIAICDAICDHNDRALKEYSDGNITYEEAKTQMFPVNAASIIRQAIAKEWDKCL